ncbi:DNA-protecting protein DprA [bacterium DOLJORAL78_65_58]|nr:MAG: DNA-protecting protein DprA [bacterium DOLZORAL124_64_63]PIE75876.1 MAG: DNA-protecting protein DprA [bacterium DOLJORAL78_65_58]
MVRTRVGGTAPVRVLNPEHAHWPPLWKQLTDPPPAVNAQGQSACLGLPAVAIVGTRRATLRGMAFARALAAALAVRGWCVVSGLALGIDAAAHRGALEAGGATVAVMGTGLGRIYPAVHADLRRQIEQQGCVLTEFATDVGPRRHHFPRRNRLIAGLVRGVVVVEAPARSGALLTAQMALDVDREVFAVPGPVDLETSRGCHHLLREGAHLVENAEDVVQVLGAPGKEGGGGVAPGVRGPAAGSAARWILDRLDFDGVPRNRLRSRFQGSEEMWCEGLLALEIAGLIRRLPGDRLARTIWRV